MITDRQKLTTKITLYRIFSLHFYHWNQFEVQETSQNSLGCQTLVHDTPRHNADGLSGRGLMMSSGYMQVIQ